MKDRIGMTLEQGDTVECYPDRDNLAQHDFIGTIVDFRTDMNGVLLAVVRDQDDCCYDMEEHELELMKDC